MKLVFMLEEPSMKEVLVQILPKLLPSQVNFTCISHQGKTDLERSLARKLRAWTEPDVRFFVLRDQDSSDCMELKAHLYKICCEAGRPDTIVRIVCHELESWFLSDLAAVERGTGVSSLAQRQNSAVYRAPDSKPNPSQLLKRLVPYYQKVSGARKISAHLDLENHRSPSFAAFVKSVRGACIYE